MCLGYTESRFGQVGVMTDQKNPHPFVTLSSQQRQKLQKTRLLKELKADTAAVWLPWHVFFGGMAAGRRDEGPSLPVPEAANWRTNQLWGAPRCALSLTRPREGSRVCPPATRRLEMSLSTHSLAAPTPVLRWSYATDRAHPPAGSCREGKDCPWYLLSCSLLRQFSFLTQQTIRFCLF